MADSNDINNFHVFSDSLIQLFICGNSLNEKTSGESAHVLDADSYFPRKTDEFIGWKKLSE